MKVVSLFFCRLVLSQFHEVFLEHKGTGEVQLTRACFQLFISWNVIYNLFIYLCSPKHSTELIMALTNTFMAIKKIKILRSLYVLLQN